MVYTIRNIREGYLKIIDSETRMNRCTCTLIMGKINVIVNTMGPWDSDRIIHGLEKVGLKPDDIQYVISTQPLFGFSGNNHLFKNSNHIVGHTFANQSAYYHEPFAQGNPLYLDGDELQVIPTPGHTLKDVSVLVKTAHGTVAITGALFEGRFDNRDNYQGVRFGNGSFFPQHQIHSRRLIMKLANRIIPGYEKMFVVTEEMRRIFCKEITL